MLKKAPDTIANSIKSVLKPFRKDLLYQAVIIEMDKIPVASKAMNIKIRTIPANNPSKTKPSIQQTTAVPKNSKNIKLVIRVFYCVSQMC